LPSHPAASPKNEKPTSKKQPTGNATYIHKRKRSPLISTDNEHKRDNGGADHYQPDSSQEHRPPRRQITVPPNMANMFAYHTG